MTIEVQLKLKSDPRYISFIHENPYWYKILNRNPEFFNLFVKDMKEKYKLTPADRINKTIDNLSMIEALLKVIK